MEKSKIEISDVNCVLPGSEASLFSAFERHSEFFVKVSSKRIMVWYRKEKIGGVSILPEHYYISKIFAENYDAEKLLISLDFNLKFKRPRHYFWSLDGLSNYEVFKTAIEKITEEEISL